MMEIIQEEFSDKFLVPSSDGKDVYHVDVEQPFCTCPDFILNKIRVGGVCKHIRLVRRLLEVDS